MAANASNFPFHSFLSLWRAPVGLTFVIEKSMQPQTNGGQCFQLFLALITVLVASAGGTSHSDPITGLFQPRHLTRRTLI